MSNASDITRNWTVNMIGQRTSLENLPAIIRDSPCVWFDHQNDGPHVKFVGQANCSIKYCISLAGK